MTEDDLRPAPAGVRAQAVLRDGTLVDDFLIREGPRTVHVLNAPSPAATASLPIGREVARRALAALAARRRGTAPARAGHAAGRPSPGRRDGRPAGPSRVGPRRHATLDRRPARPRRAP